MNTRNAMGFPANPAVGDFYEGWEWDGEKWVAVDSEIHANIEDGTTDGQITTWAVDKWSPNNAVTVDATGNVGIGMAPLRSTAKEQLAEWKSKAKTSTWSEVTDGEFNQEPTEDLVAEWIEERSVHYQNSQLQLKGYLGFGLNGGAILKIEDPENSSGSGLVTLGVTALSDSSSRWFSFGESVQDNVEGVKGSVIKVGGGKLRVGVGTVDIKGLLINKEGDVTFDNNVGIGTDSPSEALEVTGNIVSTWNDDPRFIGTRYQDGSLYSVGISLSPDESGESFVNIGAKHQIARPHIRFSTGDGTTYQERMRIDADGSVGIGSTSPASGRALTLNNESNYYGLEFQSGGTSYGRIIQESTGTMYYDANTSMVFRTNPNTERMRIGADGRVDITGSLYVNGTPKIGYSELITTLSTLRKATMDDTQDIRESLRDAIDELVAGFEQEIAAMPAEDSE
jgi:hypothetical protein